MLQKGTMEEIVNHIVNMDIKITDNSICGKCSKCGECCGNFLPLSENEMTKIAMYVKEKNIRPQKQILVMENKLFCPYFDGKKCLIYEIRPLICQKFYCFKMPSYKDAKELTKEKRTLVNMWEFAEFVDKNI